MGKSFRIDHQWEIMFAPSKHVNHPCKVFLNPYNNQLSVINKNFIMFNEILYIIKHSVRLWKYFPETFQGNCMSFSPHLTKTRSCFLKINRQKWKKVLILWDQGIFMELGWKLYIYIFFKKLNRVPQVLLLFYIMSKVCLSGRTSYHII